MKPKLYLFQKWISMKITWIYIHENFEYHSKDFKRFCKEKNWKVAEKSTLSAWEGHNKKTAFAYEEGYMKWQRLKAAEFKSIDAIIIPKRHWIFGES